MVPATADDVRQVALAMRNRDLAELSAVNLGNSRQEIADILARRYGDRADVFCARVAEEPIAIGAAVEIRPNVLSLLFFATDGFRGIALPLTRFIRRQLFPSVVAAGVHRIEAVTLHGYEHSCRWLGQLGLFREATLRGYGKRGETFDLFAWIEEDVR